MSLRLTKYIETICDKSLHVVSGNLEKLNCIDSEVFFFIATNYISFVYKCMFIFITIILLLMFIHFKLLTFFKKNLL